MGVIFENTLFAYTLFQFESGPGHHLSFPQSTKPLQNPFKNRLNLLTGAQTFSGLLSENGGNKWG